MRPAVPPSLWIRSQQLYIITIYELRRFPISQSKTAGTEAGRFNLWLGALLAFEVGGPVQNEREGVHSRVAAGLLWGHSDQESLTIVGDVESEPRGGDVGRE